jgi:CRP/FNR family transcriptional regulator, cyclic AMP receptor protein
MRGSAVSAALAGGRKNRMGPPRGMGQRWAAALADVPLFANVPRRHLRSIVRLAEEVPVRAGAPVVFRSEAGREFFVILEGIAVVRLEDGGEHRLGPGDFFGEMSVIDGRPRSAAVIAETDVVLMMLGRRQFLRLLQQEPTVALAIMTELAGRIRRLEGAGARPRS